MTVQKSSLPGRFGMMVPAGRIAALACVLAAGVAGAQQIKVGHGGNTTESEGAGQHRGPPPEALAACKSLASGAECGFTAPRGNVRGTCWAPEGRPLACRPNDGPQGAPGQKPAARQ